MLKLARKAGSHHVLCRQQRQKTENDDASPCQETKRCPEEASAHRHRLSDRGGFGKFDRRGADWRLCRILGRGTWAQPERVRPHAQFRLSFRELLAPRRSDLARRPAGLPPAQIFVGACAPLVERHAQRGKLGLVPADADTGDQSADIRSIVAKLLAVATGFRYGIISTETPTPMRIVCAAINDIATNGS
jgi:hypothetical protein